MFGRKTIDKLFQKAYKSKEYRAKLHEFRQLCWEYNYEMGTDFWPGEYFRDFLFFCEENIDEHRILSKYREILVSILCHDERRLIWYLNQKEGKEGCETFNAAVDAVIGDKVRSKYIEILYKCWEENKKDLQSVIDFLHFTVKQIKKAHCELIEGYMDEKKVEEAKELAKKIINNRKKEE